MNTVFHKVCKLCSQKGVFPQTHHGVLIYTPQKHTLSCVILRTKGVFVRTHHGGVMGTHLFLQCINDTTTN